MKRSVRRNIDIALTGLGIGIIFSAVILGGSLDIRAQLPNCADRRVDYGSRSVGPFRQAVSQ